MLKVFIFKGVSEIVILWSGDIVDDMISYCMELGKTEDLTQYYLMFAENGKVICAQRIDCYLAAIGVIKKN